MSNYFGEGVKTWSKTIIFKGIVTLFLGMLILIPVGQIQHILTERENRMYDVKEEVINMWGGRQFIDGPVLVVPIIEYYSEIIDGIKQMRSKTHSFYILPDILTINATILSEIREKGIYDVELYTGTVDIQGSFTDIKIPTITYPDSKILWDEAELLVGLGDAKGLTKEVTLNWNNNDYAFSGGAGKTELFYSGIHTDVKIKQKGNYSFKIGLKIRGGESLSFSAIGNETNVSINSNGLSPNFQGNFLPDTHIITEKGFTAKWNINALARNFPQSWIDNGIDHSIIDQGSFGVNFVSPINGYFKNHRAIKYRLMFIFIPFIAVFLFEIFTRTKVHPFQYLLVGFAISMFFLLLLSISEHLKFFYSYLISAGASSLMVALYTGSVFKSSKKGIIMFCINTILYLYLYMSLVSEDYALLIGSIGLFIILALTMIITRKLNWYKQ